ncbi:hypothetical protein DACRYDRAFT_55632 [Dacryopinax primogenitus]|uniref:Spindle pole body component n=1 Tax=Dacryopinax primogenitus (strain DJM 731) TaxID=1858805 RepID=M5FRG4_DACPD|nr:uncharacterized protein DACRYDRAFT_55632 [Dacryopinax primogenitus]EJT99710.1 hypothetical protein DACRYDRAFT_55632 [Dacryopinax primogenitus]
MATPYTPLRPASRATRRHKNLGLSAKQLNKVTSTIASARRGLREAHGQHDDEDDDDLREEERDEIEREEAATAGPSRWAGAETSFAAEPSFLQAPLNSRVPPPPAFDSPTANTKGKYRDETQDATNLKGLSLELQEAMVLEDLLYVMLGIEGMLIRYSPESPHVDDPLAGAVFLCNDTLDPSIRDLIMRLLPIATHYTALQAFIAAKSIEGCGFVNHALCGALRSVLQEHITLVTRLENAFLSTPRPGEPGLTLHSLMPHLEPSARTLALLYTLTSSLLLDPASAGSSSSDEESDVDSEEERRNAELGLGGIGNVIKGLGGDPEEEGEVLGGEVIAIVWDCMRRMAGDPLTPALLNPLLARLSTPYARTLLVWAECGLLTDPDNEFFVRSQPYLAPSFLERDYTDEYWDRRYTLRDGTPTEPGQKEKMTTGVPLPRANTGRLPGGACVPEFLDRWKRKVLLAGKYVNVIRECGRDVGTRREDWEGGMDCEPFYKRIEDAYQHANRTLLMLLVEDQQLIPRLRSLKRYFFLSQSGFFSHFLDLSMSDLKKPSRTVSLPKLQALLEVAMNLPDEGVGGFREDVKLTMAREGLYDWLLKVVAVSGDLGSIGGSAVHSEKDKEKDSKDKKDRLIAMDALTLDYAVTFPLSLVISRKTLLRYQLLFRFLLHLKVTEHALLGMWTDQLQPVWRSLPLVEASEHEAWRRRVFNLRARMLAFVQQVMAYATTEVLEPNWRKLEASLDKVSTVDQLLKDHVDFLDTCLKECMLTSSKLLKVYSRLLLTCSTFANYSSNFSKWAAKGEQDMQKRWEFFQKFEANYNHSFQVCMDCLQFYASSENTALLSLVVRLGNNGARSQGS